MFFSPFLSLSFMFSFTSSTFSMAPPLESPPTPFHFQISCYSFLNCCHILHLLHHHEIFSYDAHFVQSISSLSWIPSVLYSSNSADPLLVASVSFIRQSLLVLACCDSFYSPCTHQSAECTGKGWNNPLAAHQVLIHCFRIESAFLPGRHLRSYLNSFWQM